MKKIKNFAEFLREFVQVDPNLPSKQPFNSYEKAKTLAYNRYDDFKEKLNKVSIGEIITDIKSEESFNDKIENRDKKIEKVFDILRGAVLIDNKSEIPKVIEELKNIFDVRKIDYKTTPEGIFGYFGAVHVDVVVDNLICEIQIMPKKLWQFKTETDKIYHNYRSSDKIPAKEIERCRLLFKKANE